MTDASRDITQALNDVDAGVPGASDRLMPLIYNELRAMAAGKVAQEVPGMTLQPTALVHEVYLRIFGNIAPDRQWDHRGHFFCAAAESMRRILVDIARAKKRQKRGGGAQRQPLFESLLASEATPEVVIAVDEALEKLRLQNEEAAELVQLRYFVGLTIKEAANVLQISPRKADQIWAYARVWLAAEIGRE